jgi:hypothetical protein
MVAGRRRHVGGGGRAGDVTPVAKRETGWRLSHSRVLPSGERGLDASAMPTKVLLEGVAFIVFGLLMAAGTLRQYALYRAGTGTGTGPGLAFLGRARGGRRPIGRVMQGVSAVFVVGFGLFVAVMGVSTLMSSAHRQSLTVASHNISYGRRGNIYYYVLDTRGVDYSTSSGVYSQLVIGDTYTCMVRTYPVIIGPSIDGCDP